MHIDHDLVPGSVKNEYRVYIQDSEREECDGG